MSTKIGAEVLKNSSPSSKPLAAILNRPIACEKKNHNNNFILIAGVYHFFILDVAKIGRNYSYG